MEEDSSERQSVGTCQIILELEVFPNYVVRLMIIHGEHRRSFLYFS